MFVHRDLIRLSVLAADIDSAASELSSMAVSDDRLAWYVAHAARLLGEARDSLGRALPPSAAMAHVTSSGGAGGGAMG
ncbi:MAG: hypothetical protein ACLR82_02270 [Bifidobacterium longum]